VVKGPTRRIALALLGVGRNSRHARCAPDIRYHGLVMPRCNWLFWVHGRENRRRSLIGGISWGPPYGRKRSAVNDEMVVDLYSVRPIARAIVFLIFFKSFRDG
jgi:hypothetical protein